MINWNNCVYLAHTNMYPYGYMLRHRLCKYRFIAKLVMFYAVVFKGLRPLYNMVTDMFELNKKLKCHSS